MKKTFKMAVLAACTVLCWGFTSCFGFVAETSGGNSENTETQDENDEESLDDEQNTEPVKTPSPIKNFKVTQKEGTNFLIFSWEKLEGNDEICYWIDYENGPGTDYYFSHWYSSWEDNTILYFETKEAYKEVLMFNQTHSGTYTFSIRAHEKTGYNDSDFDADEKLTASVEYTHLILTPVLEIKDNDLREQSNDEVNNNSQNDYTRIARFRISPTLTMSGNKYCMVYVGKTDNIKEAKIRMLELDKESGEWSSNNTVERGVSISEEDGGEESFYLNCPFYNQIGNSNVGNSIYGYYWDRKTTYYMWLKLADEYVYESGESNNSGHYVDSNTYGPVSNMVKFTFEIDEDEE